jgi:putative transposase
LYLNLIYEVRDTHPGMGLRTIYEKCQPEGIGRDAFISLGLLAGYVIDPQPLGPKTTKAHPSADYPNLLNDLKFTDVNQIWTSDITYFRVGDKWCYLSFIMDVFSRRIVGYSVSDNMKSYNNVTALQMAFDLRGIENYDETLIHHSDRGSQYISDVYTGLLSDYKVKISMCTNVLENAHIERVNGTIKNQYLKHWSINNLNQLKRATEKAVNAYNYGKPHAGIIKKSPVEFENFIKNIPLSKRAEMKIFTCQQNNDKIDPAQLSLEF